MESLSVPVQPDLLPLATMPDQTTTIDEQRVPDRTVQDVLSASLEPTRVNHHEGLGEIISNGSLVSTEKLKDLEEFFDAEAEKPPITLAEAEKLQHDAAVEQKEEQEEEEEDINEPELDLVLTARTTSTLLDPSFTSSTEIIIKQDISEEMPAENKHIDIKKTQRTDIDTEKYDEVMNTGKLQSKEESSSAVSLNHQQLAPSSACEQELVRPKFTVRLKPTITFNAGDDLKLEVHFIGQPEPKVRR